ncbi:hypothetical protein [Szabonella alba]|uniref:Tetratricopeptide repeat-containing protein n=1 Tax=Szabonella alba TaxID=2804194 RepID=A0A8K0VAW6_9RHOB|nr:hypothetical protein [Szabonella alba]MBL4918311.1 hypothetical protein [Szabonella alba]
MMGPPAMTRKRAMTAVLPRCLPLLLALWLASVPGGNGRADAQTMAMPDPYAVIDGLSPFMETGDMEGAWRYLDRSIREARRLGPLSPDWALVFAMLADSIRNIGENPAYALQITDQGLDLARLGGADYANEAAALEVSRAYALADLGRMAEAVETATLALPALRATFGDQAADDLESYARDWAQGDLTIFNTSALVLARRALDGAEAAFDRGDHIAALTAAARADLPEGAGFDPGETALLRAEALALSGRALFLMGRLPEASATLDEAAAQVLHPGWQTGDVRWRQPPPQDPASRARLTELFFWHARGSIAAGQTDAADPALRIAGTLNDRAAWRVTLLLPQVQIAQAKGDAGAADRLLARAEAEAKAQGDADYATLMRFYRANNQAAMAPTWEAVDLAGLERATEAALIAAAAGPSSISPDFIRTEAAGFLAGAGAHEKALHLLRGIDSTAPARTQQDRQERRQQAEIHLGSAHAIASRDPDAFCPDVEGLGCVIYSRARD